MGRSHHQFVGAGRPARGALVSQLVGGVVDEVTGEIEEALVAHWSHLGRWTRGALVDEEGVLRYETPIPHLPYNGVIRTRFTGDDPDRAIAAVLDSFGRRGVPFLWWDHPSCSPADLGRRLAAQGLAAVENVSGMSIELDGWSAEPPRPGVRYEEVVDEKAMQAYEDLIVSYWELPEESQVQVADLNRFWGPGRLSAHRWLAYVDERPVGKVLLSLAGPPGVAAVYGMSVRPEARGKGIASGMTTTLLQRAQELGCHRVVLHSSEMAVEVYRRMGFVEHSKLTVYANAPLWSSRHH
jgi:GNAT superfamily N-acetyltransferase